MRRILLLLTFCMVAAATWASKAFPGFTSVQQKDGTTLTIQLIGNAEFSYNVTTDGVILFHEGNDYFIARIDSNGEMTSTGILAHNPGQRGAEETAAIKAQDTNKFYSYSEKEISRRRVNTMENADPAYFPHTGTPKVLVIMVEFQDLKFEDSNCKDVVDEYLNKEGIGAISVTGTVTGKTVRNNAMSVKQYFSYCSYGAFEPQFDVYGPITLSKNMAYYGAKSGSKNDAHVTDGLIPEACNLANEQGVDFTQYDSNNDGYVDLVYVIYAGYGQNIGGNSDDCIWPHVSTLGNNSTIYDGKTIKRYGVSNELNATPANPHFFNGIGVFCHEFSHGMGLPDLYPDNKMTKASLTCNQNMDNWDLMDGGEYLANGWLPKTYLAWERERCGWMQIKELTNPASITMETINNGGNAYKIVNDNNPSEYIILENIQKTGMDSYAPGHGMLAYRINEAVGLDLGYVNSTALSPAVAIVAADSLFMPEWLGKRQKVTVTETEYTVEGFTGNLIIDPILVQKYKNSTLQYDSSTGEGNGKAIYDKEAAGDPWPGTSNMTEMTGESYYAFSSVKSFMRNKPVTDIQEENGIISFKFKGGEVDGIINITDNGKPDNNYSDKVYTIDGRYIGKTTAGLRPGIYIRDGKKIVIKTN